MDAWERLLTRPADFADGTASDAWFDRVAAALLNGCRLVAGGQEHRFVEVEVYYHGPGHLDPFTHRDPVQLHNGRWYFHRTRGEYRGGSFKGLDLAFGDGQAFAGFLIRGVEKPDGTLVDGPSLFVDHLLDATGAGTVAQLDAAVGGRPAWDPAVPVSLRALDVPEGRPICRTARVGLSLKRTGKKNPEPPRFVMRPYRFLTEPRRTAKGKPHMVLALHRRGMTPEQVREVTGCPKASVARYIEDFSAGAAEADFAPFIGADLGTKELCRLHGVWHKLHGSAG